jgi:hypothetical protein
MTSSYEKYRPWSIILFLLAFVVAGCNGERQTSVEKTGVTEQHVWAQEADHHIEMPIMWEDTGQSWPASWPPSIASWATSPSGPTTINLVRRDSNGRLQRFYQTGGDAGFQEASNPTSTYLPSDGPPVVASWGPDRLDIFWLRSLPSGGTSLIHEYWDGAWNSESLGATETPTSAASAPVVATWRANQLDVFWGDASGQLRRRAFDSSMKNTPGFDARGWATKDIFLLDLPTSAFSIVEPSHNEIHVVLRLPTGKIQHRFSKVDGASWEVDNTNFTADAPPSAVSWGPGRFDMIYQRKGKLYQRWWRPQALWVDYVELNTGDMTLSMLSATAPMHGPNRIDVIMLVNDSIYHSMYLESLPGFEQIRNEDTADWCWAATATMVVDYLYTRYNGLDAPKRATCANVTMVENGLHYPNSPLNYPSTARPGQADPPRAATERPRTASPPSAPAAREPLRRPTAPGSAQNGPSGPRPPASASLARRASA